MKLYDYMKLSQADYDTCDTEYDACVTVCCIDEEDEENWFVPDEWTHAYLEMYQFVVDNLAYAKQDPVLN